MAELICEHCGHRYLVPPSALKFTPNKRWCSWACRQAAGWNASPGIAIAYTNCKLCGDLFCHPKKRSRVYCSQGCANVGRGRTQSVDRVRCPCRWCGKVVERCPSTQSKYCSRRCAGLGRPIDGRPSRIADEAIGAWAQRAARPLHETELRVGHWSIDLAFPLLMLAVELDGEYWHSLPDMVEKDQRKDAALTARGWDVRRIIIGKRDRPADVADRIDALAGIPAYRRRRRRVGHTKG